MSQYVSEAYHFGRDRLSSFTGGPLRQAYSFIFPPLDDIFLEEAGSGNSMERRASDARRATLERGVVGGSGGGSLASSSSSRSGGDQDMIDAWDSFSDSPWSFITSRYSLALIAIAIITNRIQHICRPRGRSSLLSQEKRVALRLPSLILLTRVALILITVVADYFLAESHFVNRLLRFGTSASWRDAWLANKPIEGWALNHFGDGSRDAVVRARDASALWAAFTATAVAVISDCLIRNLDADREEPPAFNMVGFAFLLHFHSFSHDAPATQHVYVCVMLQVLHILAVTLSKCRKKPFVPRLFISSFFGILSLIHYGLTARSGQYPFMEAFSRTPEVALILIIVLTITLHAITMLLLEGRIEIDRLLFSRANWPSVNEDWSIALFKVGTTCLESTRLTGLDREVAPLVTFEGPYLELKQSGQIEIVTAPRIDQVDRLRQPYAGRGDIGNTATTNSGFEREIKQIRVESWHGPHMGGLGQLQSARVRAAVTFISTAFVLLHTLAWLGLKKILHVFGLPDPAVPRWVYKTLRMIRLAWHGQNGEQRRAERLAMRLESRQREQERRHQAHGREGQLTTYQSRANTRNNQTWTASSEHALSVFLTRAGLGSRRSNTSPDDGPDTANADGRNNTDTHDHQTSQRLLEIIDGEEDADEDFSDGEDSASEDGVYDDDGEGEAEILVNIDKAEVSGLLEDFESYVDQETETTGNRAVALRSGTDAFNQLLLAHLTRRSDGPPLTRSGYTFLLSHSAGSSAVTVQHRAEELSADLHLAQTIVERRTALFSATPRSHQSGEDLRRLCVVCCVEERNVICWPCRCLCLCMECREHLASRPPNRNSTTFQAGNNRDQRNEASHLCPTCRTPVLAFSRLYIP